MVTPREGLQGPGGAVRIAATRVTPFEGQQAQQVARLGAALGDAGAQGFRLSQAMQLDLDNAKFQEASARFAELLSATETDFNQLQGEEAHKQFEEVQRNLDIKRNELEKFLTSEKQRDAFGRDSSVRRSVALNRMNAHRADQLKAHRIGATTASLDRAMRDRVKAAVTGDSPDYIRQSMVMHRKLADIAKLTGMPEEQALLAQETAESSVSTSIVEGLIESGALVRAAKFLDSVDGERIQDPVKKEKLKQRIQVANVKATAESLVDEVRTQGSALQQRRYIRSMKVPVEVKDELRRRVKAMSEEDRAEQSYQRAEALSTASEFAARGEAFPESLETKLGELGVLDRARAAARNTTTPQGEVFLETLTGKMLRAYKTPEALYNVASGMLNRADMATLMARWRAGATPEMLQAIGEEGTSRSKRTAGTQDNIPADAEVKLNDMLDVELRNASADWRGLLEGEDKLSSKAVMRQKALRIAARERYQQLLGLPGAEEGLKLMRQAIKDTLSVKSTTGRFFASMAPDEMGDATFNQRLMGDDGQYRDIQYTLRNQGVPGMDTNESAMRKIMKTRSILVEQGVQMLMARDIPEQAARSMAEDMVTKFDVMEQLGVQEDAAAREAKEVNEALLRGETVDEETAKRVGPAVEAVNDARHAMIGSWDSFVQDNSEGLESDRDDAAFIALWGKYRAGLGAAIGNSFDAWSTDPDEYRRQVVEVLFPEATPAQRQRIWSMSAAYDPRNGGFGNDPRELQQRGAIEGYHLKGYLQTSPDEVEFSYKR